MVNSINSFSLGYHDLVIFLDKELLLGRVLLLRGMWYLSSV